MELWLQHKELSLRQLWLGAIVGIAGVAGYVATEFLPLLVVPFALLYVALFFINWKTAWWVFLFFIPLSQELDLIEGVLTTTVPDEPMMWLFLLLTIVLLASRPRSFPQWWLRSPLTLVVVLQYLWMLVAIFCAERHLIAFKFGLAKTWFLAAYFVLPIFIFRKKSDFKNGFFIILLPTLLTMLVINYWHYQLGFAFSLIHKAVGRIYYNRVDYSSFMSMLFPLVVVAFVLSKGMRWWWRALLVLTILFFLMAIYFTFARGAMLAIAFAAGIAFAIRKRLVNWVLPAFFGLIALTVVYMVRHNKYIDFRPNFTHTYTHFTFADHLVATFRGEDMSSMERLYRWIAAVRMSEDKPLVGVGPNAFYFNYKPYTVSSFRTYVSRNTEHSTTHNYFLFMLVEQGWPAMLLYAALLMVFFAVAQRTYHRFKGERFYQHVTLGVAMMLAAGFIDNFFSELIETHKVGALFYFAIVLMIILDQKSREWALRGEVA
ncbi:MAG: O-antigen ligase family protein [Bacteroidetes bacterium]|nr:O-antigen ligase family protein [Bacteroidota bacterium]